MKYINLTFFIIAVTFISFFTYLEKVNNWNLSNGYDEEKCIEWANAINNDFKSAVIGGAISFEPSTSSYPTNDVNLSHSKIVAAQGKLYRENTDGNYEDVTALIPNKWDSKVSDLSLLINEKGERREDFFIISILLIVILSLLIFVNFIVTLLSNKKNKEQHISSPPLIQHKYFYFVNEQQYGPVSKRKLEELLSSNEISKTTLVWREGMTDWEEINNII